MEANKVQLIDKTKNKVIVSHLKKASSFSERLVGLLSKTSLKDNEGLWIPHCNSIHTFFMKFPIDAVFVNKQLIVQTLHPHLQPWRITWPNLKAHSVFELPSGSIQKYQIERGDQLDVGP
ncbi:MAG: DUF192 domain-containing protein [Bdellovibrio sp.]|nr:MAG: DUF192 domain-containing protein [Bdellovibrio sp.]